MKKNKVREKVQASEPVVGALLDLGSPATADIDYR